MKKTPLGPLGLRFQGEVWQYRTPEGRVEVIRRLVAPAPARVDGYSLRVRVVWALAAMVVSFIFVVFSFRAFAGGSLFVSPVATTPTIAVIAPSPSPTVTCLYRPADGAWIDIYSGSVCSPSP